MANNVGGAQVNGVATGIKDQIQAWSDSYEAGRQEVENFAIKQLPMVKPELIAKVTKCTAEILNYLWIVSGVFPILSITVFAIKRLIPLAKYSMEYVKQGATAESRKAALNEMKQEYKDSFHDTITPALLVALSVTAVFWLTYGIVALNAALLAKAACIAVPTCIALYELATNGKASPCKHVQPPAAQAEHHVEKKLGEVAVYSQTT